MLVEENAGRPAGGVLNATPGSAGHHLNRPAARGPYRE